MYSYKSIIITKIHYHPYQEESHRSISEGFYLTVNHVFSQYTFLLNFEKLNTKRSLVDALVAVSSFHYKAYM